MEGTKPRTASSIGMFDMLKGAGMLTIVFAHTAELYPMQAVSGLSLTAFFPFIYREALMAAFFIASGYGFRKRSISKCIHQQLKSLEIFAEILNAITSCENENELRACMKLR